MSDILSLQGECYVAERLVSGAAGAFRYFGDVAEVGFAMQADVFEKQEHTTGQRLIEARLARRKSATMNMTIEHATKANIALAIQGAVSTIAAGTVTTEVLPSELVVGDIVMTQKPVISTVVVKDSAVTPATLVAGTDYSILDAAAGMIKILNVGSYTQPFKVDYENGLVSNIPMFTQGLTERWFRFVGKDTANANKKKMVDFYRVSFDPASQFDLITEEINRLPMAAGILYDATKAADPVLGQFGRVVLLEE